MFVGCLMQSAWHWLEQKQFFFFFFLFFLTDPLALDSELLRDEDKVADKCHSFLLHCVSLGM